MRDSWLDSLRRDTAAQSIYRYAMRMEMAAPLRWSEVDPLVRERYREAADLALAVADTTLGPTPWYVALQTWLEHEGTGLDALMFSGDKGAARRWRMADLMRTCVSHARQAAAGLLPERWGPCARLAKLDAAEQMPPARELHNRTLTPTSKRVLVDLEGNEVLL